MNLKYSGYPRTGWQFIIWNLWKTDIAAIFPVLFNAYLEINIGRTPSPLSEPKNEKKTHKISRTLRNMTDYYTVVR